MEWFFTTTIIEKPSYFSLSAHNLTRTTQLQLEPGFQKALPLTNSRRAQEIIIIQLLGDRNDGYEDTCWSVSVEGAPVEWAA